jgi:membrane protein implicated in regulation of membrane protease activity
VAGGDSSDAPGISLFSPIVMAAFVTAFGAFGLIFSQFEFARSPLVSAPLSFAAALVVASGLVTFLGKLMRAADSSSESRVGSLAGQIATVITGLPEGGVGEIAYVQGGTRYTAPAREENGKAVASGSTVTIIRVVGSQFYVAVPSVPTIDTPKKPT